MDEIDSAKIMICRFQSDISSREQDIFVKQNRQVEGQMNVQALDYPTILSETGFNLTHKAVKYTTRKYILYYEYSK